MSTREIALNIFNTLSEEQLILFIKSFSDGANGKKAEQEKAAEQAELEERRRAFEELDRMVRENSHYVADIGDNDKEILAERLMEKYGEGL